MFARVVTRGDFAVGPLAGVARSAEDCAFVSFGCEARRLVVAEHSLELSVGDTVQVGDYTVTLIDIEIEGDSVTFQIEHHPDQELVVQSSQWMQHPR